MIDCSKDESRVRFASMFILTITWCFYSIPHINLNNEECSTYTGRYCNSTNIIRFINGCEQSQLEDYTFKCEGYMKIRGGDNSTCNILNNCVKDGYIIKNIDRFADIDISRDIIIYVYPLAILLICIVKRTLIVYIIDVFFDIILFLLTLGRTPYLLIIPCCIITSLCGIIQVFNSNKKVILTATITQSLLDIIVGIYLFILYLTIPYYDNADSNLILIPLGFACIEHIVVYLVEDKNNDNELERHTIECIDY